MRIHEVAEQAARLVAPFLALALQRAVDLRGNRKPHLAAEHDGIFGGQAVQPDDMAVEALGDHQRRFEHRARIAVTDHGQQIFHVRIPVTECLPFDSAPRFSVSIHLLGFACDSATARRHGGPRLRIDEANVPAVA